MSITENLSSEQPQPSDGRAWIHDGRRERAERELRLVGRSDDAEATTAALLDDYGHTTDAASLLLAEQQCPPEFRAFLDAVIGAARVGSGRADATGLVEISDAQLARRAGRCTKWVQEWRNKIRGWQEDSNTEFIFIRDNYREPDGTPHPHAYRVHIDELAAETVLEARRSGEWQRDPHGALEATARRVAESAPTFKPRKRRERAKRSNRAVMQTKIKQAARLLGEVADMIGFNDAWPEDEEVEGLRASMDKLSAVLSGGVNNSSLKINTDRVELGGVVENYSTCPGSVESTTYANQETQPGAEEGAAAVRAFDVAEFQITLLDDSKPKGSEPEGFERLCGAELLSFLPGLLKRNRENGESLIIRPVAPNLIQVDDCDRATLEVLQPFSFLTVETSEGNYQAWIALPVGVAKAERDATRRRLLAKLDGADRSASGAMRWPGSLNHKPGRGRFMVRLRAAAPGRTATVAELEAAGLLALVSPNPQPARPSKLRANRAPREWPDYQRCVREAKRRGDDSPDLSDADKNWSILALDRGWQPADVEAKLCELRDKARRRPDYARRTVAYAASVVNSRA
jgi:hypothetical protein